MTNEEKEWHQKLREFGCIACYVQTGIQGTPCCVHHLTRTGRRISHMHTIGLCPDHHKGAPKGSPKVSFHHNKKAFTEAYGSEFELWELSKRLLT